MFILHFLSRIYGKHFNNIAVLYVKGAYIYIFLCILRFTYTHIPYIVYAVLSQRYDQQQDLDHLPSHLFTIPIFFFPILISNIIN